MMVKTKLFLPVLLSVTALMLCLGIGMVRAGTFGTLQGKVTDATGKPVAGVKINLLGGGGGSVTTDKSGSYTLDGIDPSEYNVEVTKKGYQSQSLKVTIIQDVNQELDFTLTPAQ